jgi:hypothetical protein
MTLQNFLAGPRHSPYLARSGRARGMGVAKRGASRAARARSLGLRGLNATERRADAVTAERGRQSRGARNGGTAERRDARQGPEVAK